MTNSDTRPRTDTSEPVPAPLAGSGLGRLYRGQTAIDFVGRRRIALIVSAVLLVATVASLATRQLDLGIDFEGGVAWDVPATDEFDIDDVDGVLEANGLDAADARVQERSSDSGTIIKVQVDDQTDEVREQVQRAFAESAGLPVEEVSVNSVSSSWGRDITDKAVRALIIFLIAVTVFISIRFEWRMAIAALVATAHDVVISVGIYSLFGFVVTPATVIAFLTILGYSLYDTIVVFDRIRENEAKFAAHKVRYDDVVNVSINQVLMRSLNTSMSSIIPVLSLLIIGSGIMGATVLSEFALALLVGMLTGAYSSIFVAPPLLSALKHRDPVWAAPGRERAVGDELRALVMGGTPSGRRSRSADRPSRGTQRDEADVVESSAAPGTSPAVEDRPERLLTHAPRPRKKKRR